MDKTRCVSAIVPAFNEATRIEPVLLALSGCSYIEEIIVVDDGSVPPLEITSSLLSSVRLVRHSSNRGKAAALESGVELSLCDVLFFCDADLTGLAPKDVRLIIQPVLEGTCRMNIGIRANFEQRLVRQFALNSGERCLLKKDWQDLPAFYKKGFRIEAGLNRFVGERGKVGSILLSYRQTLREKKYGVWNGLRTRCILSWDVAYAWAHGLYSTMRY